MVFYMQGITGGQGAAPSDKGYLFLEVDVNNPKQPIIKVRTWQPEKDPNFGLYGPGDFK